MNETGWNCYAHPMISQYISNWINDEIFHFRERFHTPSTRKEFFRGCLNCPFEKKTCVQSGLHIPLNRVVKIHQTTTLWKMQPGQPPFKDWRFVGVHLSFIGGCIRLRFHPPKHPSTNQCWPNNNHRCTFPESCSPVSDEEAHLETLSRFFNRCKWRVSHKN